MLLNIILSVSYAIEIVKGLRTAGYYIIFMLVCWIPFAVGLILLKIKGRAAQYYKDVVVIGYGILYVFVLFTTHSTLAFVYILPLTSMLILFKNNHDRHCCVYYQKFPFGYERSGRYYCI